MQKRTELSDLGEFGLIEHLTKSFTTQNKNTTKAIGDDAALIDNQTLISTDMMVEGIHFDLMYTPIKHLGYKAAITNFSDIYAMNGKPEQITVSIAVSSKYSLEALEALYDGIHLACKKHGVDLIGGDTTSSLKGLVISITVTGKVEKDKVVYRNQAKPGDLICITGDLGAAYLGLQILEREKQIYLKNPEIQPELQKHEYEVGRFLKPEARKDIVELLAEKEVVPTSMIDVSDGLSSELHHICTQSKVGCNVYEANIPIAESTFHLGIELSLDPTMCALNGGEDYELLFTVDPSNEFIADSILVDVIGEITPASNGLQLHTKGNNVHPLQAQGWQHV